jgi:hypothetical protein
MTQPGWTETVAVTLSMALAKCRWGVRSRVLLQGARAGLSRQRRWI